MTRRKRHAKRRRRRHHKHKRGNFYSITQRNITGAVKNVGAVAKARTAGFKREARRKYIPAVKGGLNNVKDTAEKNIKTVQKSDLTGKVRGLFKKIKIDPVGGTVDAIKRNGLKILKFVLIVILGLTVAFIMFKVTVAAFIVKKGSSAANTPVLKRALEAIPVVGETAADIVT